jgi:hypothetical protein
MNQSIILHDINQIQKKDWFKSYSITANYTIADNDNIKTIYVTTSTNTITVTLPTAANNLDRVIEIIKIDSAFDKTGAGSKIIIDGESGETINGQTTIEIEVQYCGLRIKCDGTGWYIIDELGDCEVRDIGGTLEMIYRKYFEGTLDADSQTDIAHGVDFDKIIICIGHPYNGTSAFYAAYDYQFAQSALNQYVLYYNATNIVFGGVAARYQSQNYRAQIEYYV